MWKCTSLWVRPGAVTTGYDCIGQDTSRFGSTQPSGGQVTLTITTGNAPGNAPGIGGTCPNCGISIGAVGNVDNDAAGDVWVISTSDYTSSGPCPDGATGSAGVPHNAYNDVSCE